MTYWLNRRFKIVSAQEVQSYKWDTRQQQWVVVPTGTKGQFVEIYRDRTPAFSIFQRLREQRERPEDVKKSLIKEGTLEQEISIQEPAIIQITGWERMKSYIVWYSSSMKGRGYDTKREIALYWHKRADKDISDSQIEEWFTIAIKAIFGGWENYRSVENWVKAITATHPGKGYAYIVKRASMGEYNDVKPWDANQVMWQYLIKDRLARPPEYIYRWETEEGLIG